MEPENTIAVGEFVLDRRRLELRDAGGECVVLRQRAFAVLEYLAQHSGRVVTKDELLGAVWSGVIVTEDSLVQCISELRQALGDVAHRLIRTEPKRGYRLMPPPALAPDERGPHESVRDDPASFRQEIRFTTTADGARIAFAVSGEGPPLLRTSHWMTHLDWDWRSDVYGPRIRRLSREFQFWRYDARGCGLSDPNVAQATLEEAVLDLKAVADAAELQRFALLAFSSGGAPAVRFAAQHPERVSRLVIMGGMVRGALRRGERSQSRDTVNAMLCLIADGWGRDNAASRQFITSMLWPSADLQQMRSFNHLQRVACSPGAAADLLRSINDYDASEDLPLVRCPTLVLHNPRDARIPFEEARLIASRIVGARLETFDGPNHTPLPDEPAYEQVFRAISEFLSVDPNVGRRSASPSVHSASVAGVIEPPAALQIVHRTGSRISRRT